MTVIAHHICFWVTVCWALGKLHCWGLEGPACCFTPYFKKEDMFLIDTVWQGRGLEGEIGSAVGGLCHALSGPLCKLWLRC
jgi:hypothetical protein